MRIYLYVAVFLLQLAVLVVGQDGVKTESINANNDNVVILPQPPEAEAAAAAVDAAGSTSAPSMIGYGAEEAEEQAAEATATTAAGLRLRGTTSTTSSSTQELEATLLDLQRNDFQNIPDAIDFPELSTSQRVEKVELLRANLTNWISKLSEVEMLAMANGVTEFNSMIRNAQAQLQKVEKPVAAVVQLLLLQDQQQQESLRKDNDQADTPKTIKGQTTSPRRGRRGLLLDEVHPSDDNDDDGSPPQEGDHSTIITDQEMDSDKTFTATAAITATATQANKKTKKILKEQRAQYRRVLNDQRWRARKLFRGHVHAKLHDMQEAIYNGDHTFAKSFTSDFVQSHYGRYGKRRSSSSNGKTSSSSSDYHHGRRFLTKQEMCSQLKECASRMSKYDLFVYYYSDDIDSNTGEVDDDVITYDEKNLTGNFELIKQLASSSDDSDCDELLRRFHRVKENGNVPSWEGATVGQVCLAEGTTKFVKLEDAARTLTRTPDRLTDRAAATEADIHVSGSQRRHDLNVIFRRTMNQYESLVDTLVAEPIACTEEMWQAVTSTNVNRHEPFPFGMNGELPGFLSLTQSNHRHGHDHHHGRDLQATGRANYVITLQRMEVVRSNDSHGRDEELYGDIVVYAPRQVTLWHASRDHHIQIREGHHHTFTNREHIHRVNNFGGRVTVQARLRERDAGVMDGDDDYGHHSVHVTEGGHFVIRLNEGGHDIRVHIQVERTAITQSPTSAPTRAVSDVQAAMENVRFPTFDDRDDFPNIGELESGYYTWRDLREFSTKPHNGRVPGEEDEKGRRQLPEDGENFVEGRADYVISLTRMVVVRSNDYGHDEELYGRIVLHASEDITMWNTNRGQNMQIGRGSHRSFNNQERIQHVNNFGGQVTVEAHLWERDTRSITDGGDDDYGTQTVDVTEGGEFALQFNRGGHYVRVELQVEKTMITRSPTQSPTRASRLDVTSQEGARDEHGQILNNERSPYNFVSYHYLLNRYKTCVRDIASDLLDDLEDCDRNGTVYDLKARLHDDFFHPFHDQCLKDFFQPMREGIELVFGDRTSTGFICGMRGPLNNGRRLPGTCCLDAPYELEGDDWGRPYQCPEHGEAPTCQRYGPHFSGMSNQACEPYGGTWCPNDVDCSQLSTCIDQRMREAQTNNHTSFYHYLDSAPRINNPTNFQQCGRTLQYFGFDEYFSNYAQVCEDIDQLQFIRDFNFLNQFFGSGASGGGPSEQEAEPAPAVASNGADTPVTAAPATMGQAPDPPESIDPDMADPDYSGSQSPAVVASTVLEGAIHAEEAVLSGIVSAIEFSDNVPCPFLPFVGTFPCELVRMVVKGAMLAAKNVAEVVLKVTKFLKKVTCAIGDVLPRRETEQVEAVTSNVHATGNLVTQTTDAINGYIHDTANALFGDIFQKHESSTQLLEDLSTQLSRHDQHVADLHTSATTQQESIQQEVQTVRNNCVTKMSFDMQVQVLSQTRKSFVAVTTGLDGTPTSPDFFSIQSVGDNGTAADVPESSYTTTTANHLLGQSIVTIDASVEANVFIITAGLNEPGNVPNADALVTKVLLISFA